MFAFENTGKSRHGLSGIFGIDKTGRDQQEGVFDRLVLLYDLGLSGLI
jgi:hypothetical protein